MAEKDSIKYVISLAAIVSIIALSLGYLYFNFGNITELTSSVITEVIGALICFVSIYFLLERMGIFDTKEPLPPVVNIGLVGDQLRKITQKESEVSELRKKIESSTQLNSASILQLREKVESDIRNLESKIDATIKKLNISYNKDEKTNLTTELNGLLVQRNQKEDEYKKVRENSMLLLLFNDKIIELDKAKNEAEQLKRDLRSKSILLDSKTTELQKKQEELTKLKEESEKQQKQSLLDIGKLKSERDDYFLKNRNTSLLLEQKTKELQSVSSEVEKLKQDSVLFNKTTLDELSKAKKELQELKLETEPLIILREQAISLGEKASKTPKPKK